MVPIMEVLLQRTLKGNDVPCQAKLTGDGFCERENFRDSYLLTYFQYSDDIYLPDPPVATNFLPDISPYPDNLPSPQLTYTQQSQSVIPPLSDAFDYLDSLNSPVVDTLPSSQPDTNNMDTDFDYSQTSI